jgi:hypothetical protein
MRTILAIARRLGVALFPPKALRAACDAPMDFRGDHALSFCNRGPVSRGPRHSSLIHALSGTLRDANLHSEREKGGLLPDTQGGLTTTRPADLYVASPDACEGDGTDWVAAAFDVTVVSCYTETRERSPLLTASTKAAGHAATLAQSRKISAFLNREADIQELLRAHLRDRRVGFKSFLQAHLHSRLRACDSARSRVRGSIVAARCIV